jgi:5-methylcytosine-specific restriction enzyme B
MTLPDIFNQFFTQVENGEMKTTSFPQAYDGLKMEVGFGQGLQANIPWIAFLAPDQTVRQGIFPVFYYFKKLHWLVLAYGISEDKAPSKSWRAPLAVQTIEQFFRSKSKTPQKYHRSYVFAAYNTLFELDYQTMQSDLEKLIRHYKTLFPDLIP